MMILQDIYLISQMFCLICGHGRHPEYQLIHLISISYMAGTGNALLKAKELNARETMGRRRKRLLVMVVLGLMLWPAVLCAGTQAGGDACWLAAFTLQEKLTDQQLTQATGHGCEKPKPCQDGKIILWDEWARVRPAPVNNMGNQGQVIISGPQR